MATYDEAYRANQLIGETARLNNSVVRVLAKAANIKATFDALPPAEQNAVQSAITDLGYDSTEVGGILTLLDALNTYAIGQGLVEVEAP